MRVHYLRAAEWEEGWIEAAIDIAEACWRDNYKPKETTTDTSDVPAPCPFGYSVSNRSYVRSTY
jgi:hypothetical protein